MMHKRTKVQIVFSGLIISFLGLALLIGVGYKQFFQASEEPITWYNRGAGPYGASVCTASDPTNANIIYAGTDYAGIFKSIDGGTTWQVKNNGLTGYDVFGITINPQNPQILVAITNTGFFKSSNGGEIWFLVNDQNISQDGSSIGSSSGNNAVAYSLSNPNILYGIHSSIGAYRSENGGQSWDLINNSFPENNIIHGLAIDPVNSNKVYVGSSNGLYVTTDGGINWQSVNALNSIPNYVTYHDVRNVQINSFDPNRIYVLTYQGYLFKSINGGLTWQEISEPWGKLGDSSNDPEYPYQYLAMVLSVDSNDSTREKIYLGARGRGTDNEFDSGIFAWEGDVQNSNWTSILSDTTKQQFHNYHVDSGYAYAQKENKIRGGYSMFALQSNSTYENPKMLVNSIGYILTAYSENNIWQWDLRYKGIEEYAAVVGGFDLNNPDNFYLGMYDAGFTKSNGTGTSFVGSVKGMDCTYCLGVPPNWGGFEGHISAMAIIKNENPSLPSKIYIGAQNFNKVGGDVYLSTDGGNNWVKKSNGLPSTRPGAVQISMISLTYDKNDPNTVFLNYSRRAEDPDNPSQEDKDDCKARLGLGRDCAHLELSRNYYPPVWKYDALADSWTALPTTGLPKESTVRFRGMVYDSNTKNLFLGVTDAVPDNGQLDGSVTGGSGVYRLNIQENPSSWTSVGLNDKGWGILSLAIDNDNPATIYASQRDGGTTHIYKSNDQGNSWISTYTFPTPNLRNTTIDPNNKDVIYTSIGSYYPVQGGGVWRSQDGGYNWTDVSNNLNIMSKNISDIVINPYNSSQIVALSNGNGLFWSYSESSRVVQKPATPTFTVENINSLKEGQDVIINGKTNQANNITIYVNTADNYITTPANNNGDFSYIFTGGFGPGDYCIWATATQYDLVSEASSKVCFSVANDVCTICDNPGDDASSPPELPSANCITLGVKKYTKYTFRQSPSVISDLPSTSEQIATEQASDSEYRPEASVSNEISQNQQSTQNSAKKSVNITTIALGALMVAIGGVAMYFGIAVY